MRPLKLSIKGLNSFIEEQVIDFERLTDKGLFGIFGPTGSGKSSILDGITLALYGKIARGSTEYINKNVDVARVVFTFRLTSDRIRCYRVEREIKRNAAGDVRTSYARISELKGTEEIILEDKVSNVNRRCEEIIGLNADDFSRTVVLPQGKFSEFLKLQNAPRREMLERIFNLEQYGIELSKKISRQVQRCKDEQNELNGQLKGFESVSPEAVNDIREALKALSAALIEAKDEETRIQAAFDNASQLWQLQNDLETALKALEKHLENRELNLEKEEKIRFGELAQSLKPYWTAYEESDAGAQKTETQLASLRLEEAATREEHQKLARILEDARSSREKEMPQLKVREAELTKAAAEKRELERLKEQTEALQDDLLKTKTLLASHENREEALQLQQRTLESTVQSDEKELETLKIPESHKKQVREALALSKQLVQTSGMLDRSREKEKVLLEGIRRNLEESTSVETVIAAAASRVAVAEKHRAQLEASVPGKPEDLIRLGSQLEDIKNRWKDYRLHRTEQETAESELLRLTESLNSMERLKSEAEQRHIQLNEAFEAQQQAELADQLRQGLRSGESCPVCGSLEHPAAHTLVFDSGALAVLKQEKDEAARILREMDKNLTEAGAARRHTAEKLEKTQSALRALGTDFLGRDEAALQQELEALKNAITDHGLQLAAAERETAEAKDQLNSIEKAQTLRLGTLEADQRQLTEITAECGNLQEQLISEEAVLKDLVAPLGSIDLEARYQEISESELQAEKLDQRLTKDRETLRTLHEQLKHSGEELRKVREQAIQKETALKSHGDNAAIRTEALIAQAGPLVGIEEALEAVVRRLEELLQGFEAAEASEKRLGEKLRLQADSIVAGESALKLHREKSEQALNALNSKLRETGFLTAEEAKARLLERDTLEALKSEVKAFNTLNDQLAGGIQHIQSQLGGRSILAADWEHLQQEKLRITGAVLELSEQKAALQQTFNQIQADLAALQGLILQKQAIDSRLGNLNDLAKLFEARKFVAYIASTQLQYIAGKASEQLMAITSGSYALEADPDGDFIIRDYKNGGLTREPSTLSGGETFLVSLALALALSAQIQLKGSAPLELFFLDEGFGTLDDDVLDVVMSALENMHHEKLSIGLISHVESIKNRVPAKLLVRPARSGSGGSTVKFELS